MFRRLHQARFFLFTAKSKNILLRNDLHRADEIFLIDIPYARTLKWRPLARWAQARDIGVLFGNVTASLSDTAIELFYQAYLPDPLGLPSKTVRRHAKSDTDLAMGTRHQAPLDRENQPTHRFLDPRGNHIWMKTYSLVITALKGRMIIFINSNATGRNGSTTGMSSV